jgi:hypothetical protein
MRNGLESCARLLHAHTDKEDHVLYPVADRLFTAEDQRWLARTFDQVGVKEIGEGIHELIGRIEYKRSYTYLRRPIQSAGRNKLRLPRVLNLNFLDRAFLYQCRDGALQFSWRPPQNMEHLGHHLLIRSHHVVEVL